jgi:hypothetical protein
MAAKPFNWMKWNAFVAVLTAASFIPVSMFGMISVLDGLVPILQFFGFAAFGLLQGALIGFGQALALRNSVVSVPGKMWILASTLGAGAMWIVGQIPGYFVTVDWGNVFIAIGVLAAGLALLAFFGLVQWRVLKHRVRQAWRWVPITVVSWLGGLIILLVGFLATRSVSNLVVTVGVLTVFGTLGVLVVTVLSGYGMKILANDAISNPKYGTILPNTPRVNAAKRKVASVSAKARTKGESVAKKAATKAAPAVKKAQNAATRTVKKATKR